MLDLCLHRYNGSFNGCICTIVSRAHAEIVYGMLKNLDCRKDDKFEELDLAYFDTPTAVVVLSLSKVCTLKKKLLASLQYRYGLMYP